MTAAPITSYFVIQRRVAPEAAQHGIIARWTVRSGVDPDVRGVLQLRAGNASCMVCGCGASTYFDTPCTHIQAVIDSAREPARERPSRPRDARRHSPRRAEAAQTRGPHGRFHRNTLSTRTRRGFPP